MAVGSAKLVLGVSVLAYLFWCALQGDSLQQLTTQPKDWWLLAAAVALAAVAISLGFVRWFCVARAAGIALSLPEALRVGALGFALNFVGPGAVSGDLYKAVVLARGERGKRAAAVTTIVVDRVAGLATMLLVAGVAYRFCQPQGATQPPAEVGIAFDTALLVSLAITACIAVLFVPGVAGPGLERLVGRVPAIGGPLAALVRTWGVYRTHKAWLGAVLLACLAIDALLVASFYCVALGLPFDAPSFWQHLAIVPFELTAAAVIPTPNGAGGREAVVAWLYDGFGFDFDDGFLIAFGHTLVLLTVGAGSTVYYFARRSSVRPPATEAETLPPTSV
ncbi:MAG: lysylphosphatidylglycerol synthase transmembrane domain-containing protein [Planctomycetota bacterium]